MALQAKQWVLWTEESKPESVWVSRANPVTGWMKVFQMDGWQFESILHRFHGHLTPLSPGPAIHMGCAQSAFESLVPCWSGAGGGQPSFTAHGSA